MFDLIIAGGTIIDGTRGPRRKADVAVERGRVRVLPSGTAAAAHDVLDATGLMVVYYTHIRNETDHLLDAIDEALGIARRTGV